MWLYYLMGIRPPFWLLFRKDIRWQTNCHCVWVLGSWYSCSLEIVPLKVEIHPVLLERKYLISSALTVSNSRYYSNKHSFLGDSQMNYNQTLKQRKLRTRMISWTLQQSTGTREAGAGKGKSAPHASSAVHGFTLL